MRFFSQNFANDAYPDAANALAVDLEGRSLEKESSPGMIRQARATIFASARWLSAADHGHRVQTSNSSRTL
jgi:hypothetical protein